MGVEPLKSPLLTQGTAGAHGIQGIGANFIPGVLDRTIYDKVIPVTEEQAYEAGRLAGKKEGIAEVTLAGAQQKAVETAKKLLKMNMLSLEQIAEAINLPIEQVKKLAEEIHKD